MILHSLPALHGLEELTPACRVCHLKSLAIFSYLQLSNISAYLQFQEERMAGIALSLAPMDQIISQTIEYTRQRQAFGRSILDNQVVHFTLAELKTEVELLRSLLYRAVGASDPRPLGYLFNVKCFLHLCGMLYYCSGFS